MRAHTHILFGINNEPSVDQAKRRRGDVDGGRVGGKAKVERATFLCTQYSMDFNCSAIEI